MPKDPGTTIYYDVGLSPASDTKMKAMANQIGGTQAHVFAYATELYYQIKNRQAQNQGLRLYLEDQQGNRTEIEVPG